MKQRIWAKTLGHFSCNTLGGTELLPLQFCTALGGYQRETLGLDVGGSCSLCLLSLFLLLCIFLSFPSLLLLQVLFLGSTCNKLRLFFIQLHWKGRIFVMSGSGGDESVNEAGGHPCNNLRISIIDAIVRNNKRNSFCP